MRSQVITTFLPWAEPEHHSAAFKLFHYNYQCRVSQIHMYGLEYLREAPMPTTGRADTDRVLAQQFIHVQLTVDAMAELHHDGASIFLVDPKDAVKIYRDIRRHLQDWLGDVESSMHRRTPPIEDLRMFDQLAAAIYPFARADLVEQPFHGRLGDFLNGLSRSRGGISKRAAGPEETPAAAVAPIHTPLADSIASMDSKRRKAWS